MELTSPVPLMALDTASRSLAASRSLTDSPDCREVERAANKHRRAKTTLTGTFSR
jgi:hypothetical protein